MEYDFQCKFTVHVDDLLAGVKLPPNVEEEINHRVRYAAWLPFAMAAAQFHDPIFQAAYQPEEIQISVLFTQDEDETGYIPVVEYGQISPKKETWGIVVHCQQLPYDGAGWTPIYRTQTGDLDYYI